MKRLSALVMAMLVAMVCTMRAVAEPTGFTYIDNGDNTITLTGVTGDTPTGVFSLPSTYAGKSVVGVAQKFMERVDGVTWLTIPTGVRFIGREAFHEISTLERVSLPATLTNVNEKVFGDCPKLAEFVMPGENDYVKIVDGVLCDFGLKTAIAAESGVTALSLPKGILRIGKQAFAGHTKLKTADLEASDLETMAKNAFAGCTSLTGVIFPLTFAGAEAEPFLFCAKLKAVYFLGLPPDVDESFYWLKEDNPSSLVPATTYVKLGRGWDSFYVKGSWCGRPVAYVAPYVFEYAENPDGTITLTGVNGQLTKGALTIGPTYDGLSVAGVGAKFMEKTAGVTALTIAEGIRFIGREAFHDIPTLTSVSLPSTLTNVGEKAFCDCPKLSKIMVAGYNEDVNVLNNVLYDFGLKTAIVGANTLTTLTIPDGITRLGAQAFCACTKMKTADLMTSDLVKMGKNAFAGCTALTSVYFPPSFAEAAVEPFLACSRLKEVYFFGPPPTVDESFYWLREDDPASVSKTVTTIVRENKGWTDVPGEWMGRPVVYGDPYVLTDYCAGSSLLVGTISGGNRAVKAGAVVTLKATAVKNYVFAGWYCDEVGTNTAVGVNDYRSPGFQYKVEHDAELYAKFIPKTEDTYILVVCDFDPAGYPAGEYVSIPVTVLSQSLPTVTVSGLPAGLKYDAKTMTISGVPTKAGDFNVTIAAKNASGATVRKPCPVTVHFYALALKAVIDGDTHDLPTTGLKLTGAGRYAANKTVKLSATAPKGYVFTGWTDQGGAPLDNGSQDYRTASSYAYTTVTNDVTLCAHFRTIQEDFCDNITVEDEVLVPQGKITVDSKSLPIITVTGLPAGLTFDKKANGLVFNPLKMKVGEYAFVITAKNAAGYKVDRVVTFAYGGSVTDPVCTFAPGEIVYARVEDLVGYNANVTGLPAGLKCVKVWDDDLEEYVYYISGITTKVGRFTVKVDGESYFMITQGAPSRYVEVATDGTPGCTASGSGVYAAGATVKTSAKAASGFAFAGWYEGTNAYGNVYAEYLGKGGDPRVAAQTWLLGEYWDEGAVVFVPTLPIVPGKNYARLTGDFVPKVLDFPGDISVVSQETLEEVGATWNVLIDDGEHTLLTDACSTIRVGVDSISAPRLTVKGSVSGLTIKNYGTYAEIGYAAGSRKPTPGEYTLTFTAVNQSNRSVTRTLTVRVPNVEDLTGIIWPNYDEKGAFFKGSYESAVNYTAGETVFQSDVDVFGYVPAGMTRTISVKGLPPGVTYADGAFTGVPTKAGCYTVTVTVRFRYDGEVRWNTTSATVYFRVKEIDTSVVGTFNGGVWDAETNALGTITATLASSGKLSAVKIVNLLGGTTTLALTEQRFVVEEDHCELCATSKGGLVYYFKFYPVAESKEGERDVGLAGEMNVTFSDYSLAGFALQNVWSDKDLKDEGLLPVFPSKGIAVPYLPDALKLVFKPAGVVSATIGKKTTSNRFELASLTFDEEGAWTGWLGYVTVNVPDGTDEGYCKVFEVAVSADSEITDITPIGEESTNENE